MRALLIVITAALLQCAYGIPQPLNISSWVNKKVMFLAAHPDDIEGIVGATNGDKGCSNQPLCGNWTTEQIGARRQIEALNAAKVNGVPPSNVAFLGYEDCMVTSNETAILQAFIQYIRAWQPDVVMSFYFLPRLQLQPNQWGDLGFHPDHQAVGSIALTARFEAGVRRQYPQLGAAWSVPEYYEVLFDNLKIWEMWQPTLYADISSALPQKIAAFSQHQTQYSSYDAMAQAITQQALNVATNAGITSVVQYAEGFIPYNE